MRNQHVYKGAKKVISRIDYCDILSAPQRYGSAPPSALLPAAVGLHYGACAETSESLYLALAAVGHWIGEPKHKQRPINTCCVMITSYCSGKIIRRLRAHRPIN